MSDASKRRTSDPGLLLENSKSFVLKRGSAKPDQQRWKDLLDKLVDSSTLLPRLRSPSWALLTHQSMPINESNDRMTSAASNDGGGAWSTQPTATQQRRVSLAATPTTPRVFNDESLSASASSTSSASFARRKSSTYDEIEAARRKADLQSLGYVVL